MAVCESCWQRAAQDVYIRGGSVVDHYRRRLTEHDPEVEDASDDPES